jgi:hypothetical protein
MRLRPAGNGPIGKQTGKQPAIRVARVELGNRPVVASVGMSRWLLVAGGSIFALAGVNALIDRRRTCACLADCWCKTTLGRNFRWVAPMRHHLPEYN